MKLALIFLCDGWDYFPPLHLVSIASYIKKNSTDTEVRIFDLNFDDIDNSLEKFNPDIIGITSMSPEYTKFSKKAELLKKKFNTPLIIGGTHISVLPESLNKTYDIGIVGEGEKTTLELIDHFKKFKKLNKEELTKIKGLVFYKDDKLIKTEARELMDLNELPKMDWSLINPQYFSKALPEKDYTKIAYLMSSRGCPYKCRFCSSSYYWKIPRYQSSSQVIEEIKDLYHNYKIKRIHFSDDLFCLNLTRVKEMIELLKQENLLGKIKFSCNLRANLVNEDMLKTLKELGIITVGFGFESGSEKYLAYLKRDAVTVEQNKKAIKLCNQYGIGAAGSLMLGGPNETIEDMQQTLNFIDFCVEEKIENLGIFVLTPFPGNEMWEIAKERKKVTDQLDDWGKLDYVNVEDAFLLDDSINKKEFNEIFQKSREKLKYFRMKRLSRLIKSHPIRTAAEALKNPKNAISSIFRIVLSKSKEGR